MIFAEGSLDILPPWISLLRDLGAFGLLGYLVIYLAPTMWREARAEREKLDEAAKRERMERDERFYEALNHLQEKFEDRNEKIVGAIEKQTAATISAFDKGIQAVCNYRH